MASSGSFTDAECVWSPRPGEHRSNEDESVIETVWPTGLRRYKNDMVRVRPYRVLMIGCSYTFGVGVSDEDSYVWRLNELMPEVEFVNAGVGGYGPLASLCWMRRHIKQQPYDLVIYGFIDEHCRRCSLPAVRYMDEQDRRFRRPRIAETAYDMPIVELNKGFRFVDHYPRRSSVPGDYISPLMNFLGLYENAFRIRHMRVPRYCEMQTICSHILQRQALVAASYGIPYMVVNLQGSLEPHLYSPIMNCIDTECEISNEDRIGGKGYNHPGARIHDIWARTIVQHLRQPEVYKKLIAHSKPAHRTVYDLDEEPEGFPFRNMYGD